MAKDRRPLISPASVAYQTLADGDRRIQNLERAEVITTGNRVTFVDKTKHRRSSPPIIPIKPPVSIASFAVVGTFSERIISVEEPGLYPISLSTFASAAVGDILFLVIHNANAFNPGETPYEAELPAVSYPGLEFVEVATIVRDLQADVYGRLSLFRAVVPSDDIDFEAGGFASFANSYEFSYAVVETTPVFVRQAASATDVSADVTVHLVVDSPITMSFAHLGGLESYTGTLIVGDVDEGAFDPIMPFVQWEFNQQDPQMIMPVEYNDRSWAMIAVTLAP